MRKNNSKTIANSIQKMMENFCNIGNQMERTNSLLALSQILINYSNKCIELSRHSEGNAEILSIGATKKNLNLKIPKYRWHGHYVSEIRFAIRDTNPPYKIALYRPTGKRDLYGYEYEFVGVMD